MQHQAYSSSLASKHTSSYRKCCLKIGLHRNSRATTSIRTDRLQTALSLKTKSLLKTGFKIYFETKVEAKIGLGLHECEGSGIARGFRGSKKPHSDG
jgi:hypothetical protein